MIQISVLRALVSIQFSSVQLLSCVQLFATSWTAASQASLPVINSWSLLKLMSIESVMTSNHLIHYCLLLLLFSIFPNIRVIYNELVLHIRWPKFCSFNFSINPSNEYSGLIFRMDLLDLLAVQGLSRVFCNTQCKSIGSSVLSFLDSPILTTIHDYWKNHSFDQMDLCWKSMSQLFNMLSRLVITFLPSSKRLLISWLQSPSAVILEPKKIKSVTFCHEAMGPNATILVFFSECQF